MEGMHPPGPIPSRDSVSNLFFAVQCSTRRQKLRIVGRRSLIISAKLRLRTPISVLRQAGEQLPMTVIVPYGC